MAAFTLLHVLISLVGILSGVVVILGLIGNHLMPRWNSVFLVTTVATSVTGFMFPVHHFLPSHAVGILSLIVLTVAILALYAHDLSGGWRRTYALTAVFAVYLNVFVLVVQSFLKVPFLHALAPTGTERPFAVVQGVVLIVFIVFGIAAARKFRLAPGILL